MRAASMPKVVASGASSVSPQQKIGNMFQQIDSSGAGRITKEQFEQAFNKLNLPASVKEIGPEAAFSKLDPTGSGAVSKQDFIHGMTSLMAQKNAQPHKEASLEVKTSPAATAPTKNVASQNSSSNIPPPPAGGPIGNTINVAA
jgi:hypothetical protein